MKTAPYLLATAQIDAQLRALLAETPSRPAPYPSYPQTGGRGLAQAVHHDSIVELVELGHFVLSGVVPSPLVVPHACVAANDDGHGSGHSSHRLEEGHPNLPASAKRNPLDHLTGPLRQSVIQLLASTAKIALPALRTRSSKGTKKEAWRARFRRMRNELRIQAKEIALEIGMASAGEIIVDLIRGLTSEIDLVCQRLLRAMQHSMLPFLQALRSLFFPDPNISYQESMDAAIRLFVQAGVVAGSVLVEQALDNLIHCVFPLPYIGVIVTCFMAFVCSLALKWAMHQLDELDPVGVRRYHEMFGQVETLNRRGQEFDKRMSVLLKSEKSC